jgi:hypothetical protein
MAKPMHDSNSAQQSLYFFRVFTNGVETHHSEGLEFSSKEDVWHEASTSTGEIIREMDGNMHAGLDWRMDVTDAGGKVIYRFSFKAEDLTS